jgi:hypothetical protein
MKELSPREIRDRINNGKLEPEQAIKLFKGLHQQEVAPVVYQGMERESRLKRIGMDLFNHNNAQAHYEQRMDLEEGVRHAVGLPIYGAVAGVDAVVDALSFGVTEIVEDTTFLISRTIFRARDGWERGKVK